MGDGRELPFVRDYRPRRTADAGRYDCDRQCADSQCSCARTLSRYARLWRRRAAGRTGLTTTERPVRLPVGRLLAVAPVELLRICLLLPMGGIAWGPTLIGHRGIPGLLRRWRIPRVIRHVARSLFPWTVGSDLTVTGSLPCLRGLRFD